MSYWENIDRLWAVGLTVTLIFVGLWIFGADQMTEPKTIGDTWVHSTTSLAATGYGPFPTTTTSTTTSTTTTTMAVRTTAAKTTTAPTTTNDSWTPADECADVPNPGPVYLTGDTMRWCPTVARYLSEWDWQPGDLTRFMVVMECESNGDPVVVNPLSGTTGLYQHRPRFFYERAARAGISNPDPTMPFDNIKTAVWLIKSGEQQWWQAWDGCWPQIRSTLANAGVLP